MNAEAASYPYKNCGLCKIIAIARKRFFNQSELQEKIEPQDA